MIVDGAERRRDAQVGIVAADSIAREVTDAHPALDADQAAAVSAIASGGHGVNLVSALAGTGETTMLAAVAECYYRVAGYRVIGTAPTARAARELRDTARVPAGTMHSLIGEVDRAGGFRSGRCS